MRAQRFFVENVTDQSNRYFVGTDDHGYAKRTDAEKALNDLSDRFPDQVYTIYVRGQRTQQS